MRTRVFPLALALAACAAPPRVTAPPRDDDDPAARAALVAGTLDGYQAAFVLTWEGQRIGEAREHFAALEAPDRFRFERQERVVVRRDGTMATLRTTITIDTDAALHALEVRVLRAGASGETMATATRLNDGSWQIVVGQAPARIADGRAVPSTLVPLLVAASGAQGHVFSGPVLVEGAGLARADLEVDVDARTHLGHARIKTRAGELRSLVVLDEQGRVREAGRGAALGSRRVDEAELAEAFDPPDVVDDSVVAVDGNPGAASGLRLEIAGVAASPPRLAELPDQAIVAAGDGGWDVRVGSSMWLSGSEWRDVAAQVHAVSRRLGDDLAISTFSPEEALAAGRGDCTTHAVVLEHELTTRGYQARLVTGFVLDEGRLHRHRWVVVQIGKRWVPVDPMFDEVPAQPTHIALAVTGSSTDELAFVDDVVFAPWRGARASF